MRRKLGFIGVGNIGKAFIRGFIETKTFQPDDIIVHDIIEGRHNKIVSRFGVIGAHSDEQVVEDSDIVIVAIKSHDVLAALEPIASVFKPKQIVISLASSVSSEALKKVLPDCRLARVVPSLSIFISKGVLGYCTKESDVALDQVLSDLLSPLGTLLKFNEGDEFNAHIVAVASGTGFIFELMQYWQEWIEERGIAAPVAREMTVQTFLGAAMLAADSKDVAITDLESRTTIKRGVTEAGLESMRELDIERLIRYSLEKAAMRNEDLSKKDSSAPR